MTEDFFVSPPDFRVESNHPIAGRLWPAPGAHQYCFNNRHLAVATAAKSVTRPSGQEIRVVHVPTGKVVFSKPASARVEWADEE